MKLLISDYDYTIKPYENNPNIIEKNIFRKNIQAINSFVDNGNIFAIATGRNTQSIQEETKKFDIKYDYLIAYNGRVIVDKFGNIIYANYLEREILELFLNSGLVKDFILFNEFASTDKKDNLIYSKLKLKTYQNIREFILEIKEKFPNIKIDYNYIFNTLNIRKNFNKYLGIEELLKKEKIYIDTKDIYTVGDESNDYEMLSNYNGYRMLLSNPKLIFATNNVTPTVNRLIKTIEKNI